MSAFFDQHKFMKKEPSARTSDPRELMDQVEKRFKKLSAKKKIQTLVDAGILTKNNKVREPYKEVLASI